MKIDVTVPVRVPDMRWAQVAGDPGDDGFQALWAAGLQPDLPELRAAPDQALPLTESFAPVSDVPPDTASMAEAPPMGQTTAAWRVSTSATDVGPPVTDVLPNPAGVRPVADGAGRATVPAAVADPSLATRPPAADPQHVPRTHPTPPDLRAAAPGPTAAQTGVPTLPDRDLPRPPTDAPGQLIDSRRSLPATAARHADASAPVPLSPVPSNPGAASLRGINLDPHPEPRGSGPALVSSQQGAAPASGTKAQPNAAPLPAGVAPAPQSVVAAPAGQIGAERAVIPVQAAKGAARLLSPAHLALPAPPGMAFATSVPQAPTLALPPRTPGAAATTAELTPQPGQNASPQPVQRGLSANAPDQPSDAEGGVWPRPQRAVLRPAAAPAAPAGHPDRPQGATAPMPPAPARMAPFVAAKTPVALPTTAAVATPVEMAVGQLSLQTRPVLSTPGGKTALVPPTETAAPLIPVLAPAAGARVVQPLQVTPQPLERAAEIAVAPVRGVAEPDHIPADRLHIAPQVIARADVSAATLVGPQGQPPALPDAPAALPAPAAWSFALARAADAHARLPQSRDAGGDICMPSRPPPRPDTGTLTAAAPLPEISGPGALAPMTVGPVAAPEENPLGTSAAAALSQFDSPSPRPAGQDQRFIPPPPQQIADALRHTTGNRVELTLAPEELGRVTLTFQPEGDGVRVHLVADRPETMDLLRRNAPELAAELRAAGYETASFSFGRQGQTPQKGQDAGSDPDMADGPPPPGPATVRVTSGALDLRL